jgi:hypothetical protein
VGIEIPGLQEMDVVGRHHRHIEIRRQGNALMQTALLIRAAGAVQLQVVAVTEQLQPVTQQFLRQSPVTRQQGLAHIALTPGGQGDQPFGITRQPVRLDQRTSQVLPFPVTT